MSYYGLPAHNPCRLPTTVVDPLIKGLQLVRGDTLPTRHTLPFALGSSALIPVVGIVEPDTYAGLPYTLERKANIEVGLIQPSITRNSLRNFGLRLSVSVHTDPGQKQGLIGIPACQPNGMSTEEENVFEQALAQSQGYEVITCDIDAVQEGGRTVAVYGNDADGSHPLPFRSDAAYGFVSAVQHIVAIKDLGIQPYS